MESQNFPRELIILESFIDVVNSGSCSGCGACAVVSQGAIEMQLQPNRTYLPVQISKVKGKVPNVCPFTSNSFSRQEIGTVKSGLNAKTAQLIGSYNFLGAGRVNDESIYQSSSGGLTSWLLEKLLDLNMVDGIIHVGNVAATDQTSLFEYSISTNSKEIQAKKGSKYYATNFQEVLTSINAGNKNYAFVGVPCFVNAIDLMRLHDPKWNNRILYTIGLVCGHLKSQLYAEALAWQLDVKPDEIERVDFRLKTEGAPSSNYKFGVKTFNEPDWRTRDSKDLIGTNWGHNAFALSSCNACTDLFAYTSDITLGDAWLPEYEKNPKGTNIFVIRSETLLDIFVKGKESKEITLDTLREDQILESQSGNVSHRVVGYEIRNSKRFRLGNAQSDYTGEFVTPTCRRKILIRHRKKMQTTTGSLKSLATELEFVGWINEFKGQIRKYRILDRLSRVNLRWVSNKIRRHLTTKWNRSSE
jgi:coenzyme F420 hydrogenase subunit beta